MADRLTTMQEATATRPLRQTLLSYSDPVINFPGAGDDLQRPSPFTTAGKGEGVNGLRSLSFYAGLKPKQNEVILLREREKERDLA